MDRLGGGINKGYDCLSLYVCVHCQQWQPDQSYALCNPSVRTKSPHESHNRWNVVQGGRGGGG
jgi:hypothetical protein